MKRLLVVVLLLSLGGLCFFGTLNMNRLIAEVEQKAALYQSLTPDEAKKMMLVDLKKEKERLQRQKLF